MKYAVLVYESPEQVKLRQDPQRGPAYWAAYKAYGQTLIDSGVAAGGEGLEPPSSGTTVRVRGSERQVQDGPFAETKELLGGFFLIDVPDLETALVWASRCPAASSGCVEVRPVLPPIA